MAKFTTGQELEKVIYDIIWEAENILLIVSPFIKLDDYFKKLFDKHINNPKLHIVVVFGKNQGTVNKSLSKSDFDFFKKFLNVTVIYAPSLHAKYYGNERKGVITSINLYDYSFKNNIEFGVYSEQNILSNITNSPDRDAWDTCYQIAKNNEVVFVKRPVLEKKLLSSVLGKRYVKSDILHDVTDKFYGSSNRRREETTIKKLSNFPNELILGPQQKVRPIREKEETPTTGYCIRTGEKIPFNPKRPYSDKAYKIWAQYKNENYPEYYCHKTGKPSHGKTSMKNPILNK